MVQNLNSKIILILILTIGSAVALNFLNIELGLDLKGGSSIRYQLPLDDVDTDNRKRIVEETIEVFRTRIETINKIGIKGLKEIPIRAYGDDQILIELPNMEPSEVEAILDIINSQGKLEWYIVAESEQDRDDPNEIAVDLNDKRTELAAFLTEKGNWSLETDLSSLDESLKMNGKDVIYRWYPRAEKALEKDGHKIPEPNSTFADLEAETDEAKTALIAKYFVLIKIFKSPDWFFTGGDLAEVGSNRDREGRPIVEFEFKSGRKSHFEDFTRAHEKKQLAILLDDKVFSDPNIQTALPGAGYIEGGGLQGFTHDEQKALLTVLQSGSIEVKPTILARHDLGPTLGENSIQRGQLAGIIGLVVVFVFIIVYYMLSGVVASISLALNLLLLMGVLVTLGTTLTLPGIAGIILTVGMAVDANILIFERIREEKDKGKTIAQAVKNGFDRAFLTIVDANATTFITGYFLYNFGTGPIQGFAATLMIGIVTSLFSALLISRVVFAIMLTRGLQNLNMLRFLKKTAINFIGMKGKAWTVSILIIIAGLVLFIMEDDSKYGLDLKGGYNAHVVCNGDTTQADVQSDLRSVFPNVQVISVTREDGLQEFNVKIKETALGTIESGDSGRTTRKSDLFQAKLQEIMGERIIPAPISDLEFTATESNTVFRTTLNFSSPPATEAQTSDKSREEKVAIYKENIRKALEKDDFLTVTEQEVSGNGLQIKVTGTVGRTGIQEEAFRGDLLQQIRQSSKELMDSEENNVVLSLTMPFPLTDYIDPVVGKELQDKAIIAIFLSLLAIVIYIRLRFKDYNYGFAACIALIHDVLITLGAVAFIRLTGLVDVEISLPLIAAFLTIIGYSLNDTIVVFDRIRENLPRMNRPYIEVINASINQTLSRTILTSMTTLLVVTILFALNLGQRNVLEGFSFALIVGVLVGTYSSIFVASPALVLLHQREASRGKVKAVAAGKK